MDISGITPPDISQIDAFLAVHTGQGDPTGDIRVTKAGTFTAEGEPDDLPIIQGFGSSNIRDTDNDTFHVSALKSLQATSEGLNTWRSHKFGLPDDLMGSIQDIPALTNGPEDWPTGVIPPDKKDWVGLWVKSDVELENPPAARMYKFIQPTAKRPGRRFGWSVGAVFTQFKRKTDGRGAIKGFDVHECRALEWSLVGVPANQASWVAITKEFLVRKGVLPPDEDSLEVAYVFKHWDEIPDPVQAARLRALQETLITDFGLCLAEPASRKHWAVGAS